MPGKDWVPTEAWLSGRHNRVQKLGWVGQEHDREALGPTNCPAASLGSGEGRHALKGRGHGEHGKGLFKGHLT